MIKIYLCNLSDQKDFSGPRNLSEQSDFKLSDPSNFSDQSNLSNPSK